MSSSSIKGAAAPSPDFQALRLEAESLVRLPDRPFRLSPEESRLLFLDTRQLRAKSASFDGREVRGVVAPQAVVTDIESLLRRFGDWARATVVDLAPRYVDALEAGRASLRLRDAADAPLSARKDDRRLHVDAFASQPTGGRRILRVFANINPWGEPRLWRVAEPFEVHARRFLPRLRDLWPGESQILNALGLTRGRRTRYDALMLGLHDAAKGDLDYQREANATDIAFAAGESWVVFTDSAVHAALKGRFALEQTFYLPVEAMAAPGAAPLRVLERLTGRMLS